jgi:hypothetical protein
MKGQLNIAVTATLVVLLMGVGGWVFTAPYLGNTGLSRTLVSVSDEGVDIANLLMAGILDKTGHVPLGGDEVCFEIAVCGEAG